MAFEFFIMSNFSQIAIMAIALKNILSQCLSNADLLTLGFKTPVSAQISAPTYCKNLYTAGACVSEADFKAQSDVAVNNLLLRMDIRTSLKDSFLSIITKVSSTVTSTSNTTSAALTTIMNAADTNVSQCFQNQANLVLGTECLLTSSGAQQKTVSTATDITVKVKPSVVGPLLETCLPFYDAVCILTTGISLTSTIDFSSNILTKVNANIALCNGLKAFNCGSADTTCVSNRRNYLINTFYQPFNLSFYPEKTLYDNIKNSISNFFSSINPFKRRLQTAKTVKYSGDEAAGQDTATDGNNSGYTKPTLKTVSIIGIISFLLFSIRF